MINLFESMTLSSRQVDHVGSVLDSGEVWSIVAGDPECDVMAANAHAPHRTKHHDLSREIRLFLVAHVPRSSCHRSHPLDHCGAFHPSLAITCQEASMTLPLCVATLQRPEQRQIQGEIYFL
jgi:hypothetical protein